MNGAEALIATALSEGIEVCFANPGTTEMPMVAALDTVPGIRGILFLHENAATGAADGYARMAGKPAMTVLHLGPGLMNGLTNLHNARRAHSPVFNVIGEHASWHVRADPLLATDIEGVARTIHGYVKENLGATTVAMDTAQTIAEAMAHGGRSGTLILPHDSQLGDAGDVIPVPRTAEKAGFASGHVIETARRLKAGKSALFLGGDGLSEDALMLAGRIAAGTGAELICETFVARMEKGGGLPAPVKLPYRPEDAIALTGQFDTVVIIGTARPIAFFGYPGGPSELTTDAQTISLAAPGEDIVGALAALADELSAPDAPAPRAATLPDMPKGALDGPAISAVIANLQPQGAIVMDEGLTSAAAYHAFSDASPRFTHMQLTGGAIGEGPGASTGAAIACPDRQVINFQADGSGAYSVQALWTQAREQLDVVTIIAANRRYNILGFELERAGIMNPGPVTRSMVSLNGPHLDWVKIAEGFGVPGVAVDTAEGLAEALEDALEAQGPRLIEAVMG
ncbi:MAG: acetolactate synthase large subunit [Alphaproteobacteria bacterium]